MSLMGNIHHNNTEFLYELKPGERAAFIERDSGELMAVITHPDRPTFCVKPDGTHVALPNIEPRKHQFLDSEMYWDDRLRAGWRRLMVRLGQK
jgi:hypothetical protein